MIEELIYTSAPKGLKPGSHGFCTVLSTAGMAQTTAERLEALSGYRHAFPLHDARAVLNPVNYSHVTLRLGGRPTHVLSRIADAGQDYSGRSNKLAHHIALDQTQSFSCGPARLLQDPAVVCSAWDGSVRTFAPRRLPMPPLPKTIALTAWNQAAGDHGWAGWIAEQLLQGAIVHVVFKPGTPNLELVREVIDLVPAAQKWDITFSTYFTRLPAGVECQLRFVLDDTPEAISLRHDARAKVVDLTQPLSPPTGGRLTTAARAGVLSTTPATVPPAMPGPANRTHGKPTAIPAADPGHGGNGEPVSPSQTTQFGTRNVPEMPAAPFLAPQLPGSVRYSGKRRRWPGKLIFTVLSLLVLSAMLTAAFFVGRWHNTQVSEATNQFAAKQPVAQTPAAAKTPATKSQLDGPVKQAAAKPESAMAAASVPVPPLPAVTQPPVSQPPPEPQLQVSEAQPAPQPQPAPELTAPKLARFQPAGDRTLYPDTRTILWDWKDKQAASGERLPVRLPASANLTISPWAPYATARTDVNGISLQITPKTDSPFEWLVTAGNGNDEIPVGEIHLNRMPQSGSSQDTCELQFVWDAKVPEEIESFTRWCPLELRVGEDSIRCVLSPPIRLEPDVTVSDFCKRGYADVPAIGTGIFETIGSPKKGQLGIEIRSEASPGQVLEFTAEKESLRIPLTPEGHFQPPDQQASEGPLFAMNLELRPQDNGEQSGKVLKLLADLAVEIPRIGLKMADKPGKDAPETLLALSQLRNTQADFSVERLDEARAAFASFPGIFNRATENPEARVNRDFRDAEKVCKELVEDALQKRVMVLDGTLSGLQKQQETVRADSALDQKMREERLGVLAMQKEMAEATKTAAKALLQEAERQAAWFRDNREPTIESLRRTRDIILRSSYRITWFVDFPVADAAVPDPERRGRVRLMELRINGSMEAPK